MSQFEQLVEATLSGLPSQVPGPGGAVAVLKDGHLVRQHVWGYANIDERLPMTADTIMPICSITKQMLCALVVDLQQNPTATMRAKGCVAEQFTQQLCNVLGSQLTKGTGLTVDHLATIIPVFATIGP